MAAIGGFLLTAIPSWTNRPPVAGKPLGALVVLWLLGRMVCLFSALMPGWVAPVCDLGFPLGLEILAVHELMAVGNRQNYPVLAPVVLIAIGNLLMHLQALDIAVPIGLGWRLAVAVVILLISVIAGRIVPAFTRNWLNARGMLPVPPPVEPLDRLALGTLHGGMIAWAFLPSWQPVGVLLLIAALLNLARLSRWRGYATFQEPLLVILHLGYLWLVVGVTLLGLSILSDQVPVAAAIHALTAGTIGTMTLAVMTRATLGHTGRVLHADTITDLIYGLVTGAAILRIASAWTMDVQMDLLEISGVAWVGAFALFVGEYGPMLLAPRR